MISRILKIVSVAAFLGFVGYSGAVGRAQADATCTQWDESDPMRCFDCIRVVNTPFGPRSVNTCPRRVFRGYWYGWWRG